VSNSANDFSVIVAVKVLLSEGQVSMTGARK